MNDGNTSLAAPNRLQVVAFAMVLAAAGIVLVLRPFDDTSRLARLIGVGLVLLGIDFLVSARSSIAKRVAGAVNGIVWGTVGLAVLVWTSPTVRGLAIWIGVGLIVTGVIEIIAAARGRRTGRWTEVFGGVSSVFFGVAAVAWPTITTLVLSIVVGARLIVAAGMRLGDLRATDASTSRWRLGARSTIAVLGVLVALLVAGVSIVVNRAQPDGPGDFYSAPDVLPGPPGTVIRSEVVEPFLDGATTHRVLYVTSGRDEEPITSSGLVIVPDGPAPEGGRPVMAFTHGTVGIDRRCSLSLLPGDVYGPAIPGIRAFLDAGFVVAATDYAGLGSEATTGYLVGSSQAYSALDSVRAAVSMPEAGAANRFAVFGESQGGQAALFTGQYAADYAPELELVGVAAAAPATNLTALFEENAGTTFGDVLASFALVSWQRFYGIDLDEIVAEQAVPVIERIAGQCLQDEAQMLAVFPEAELLKIEFFRVQPWDTEPWSTILDENTPGSTLIDAPVLIAQGSVDPLVLPTVQQEFVDAWCNNGQALDYRVYDGVGHLDAGQASGADISAWAVQRFAGEPWQPTCGG